jgi:hypothetical protein
MEISLNTRKKSDFSNNPDQVAIHQSLSVIHPEKFSLTIVPQYLWFRKQKTIVRTLGVRSHF